MANLLRQRDQIVDQMARAWARETIRYRRQDPTTREWSEISVLAGLHAPEAIGQFADLGSLVNSSEIMFSITATDIDFGQGPVSPREGDEVLTTSIGGESRTYRVTKRDGRAWRYVDEYGIAVFVFGEWS